MRSLAAATVVGATTLLLAACGGGGSTPDVTFSPLPTSGSPTASGQPTVSPTAPASVGNAPLTGLPVTTTAALHRSVVAVSVNLVPGVVTRGLPTADVVYQEFDHPGRSRLLALYQSVDAPSVGPVAPTAPVDMRILFLLANPAYGFAGGPMGFVTQAQAGPVTPRDAGLFPSLYRGPTSGKVTSSVALRSSVKAPAAPPSGTLTFASEGTPLPTAGKALTRLVVTVPGHAPEAFAWTSKGWVGPGGVAVSNVIVQVVPYKTITPHKDPPVASAQVIGSGPATVFARNHAVAVAWSRPQPGLVTIYRVGVNPIGLAPGRTWIMLVPAGTKVTPT